MALQEAIDNFKTISSQNGELIGQNNILIRKVNELSELAKGKQEIVDAINIMGGNASIEDSLYTLGEKIEQLVVVSPDTTFTDDVPTPINLSTIAVQPSIYVPYIKHLYSETTTLPVFRKDSIVELVSAPNVLSLAGNFQTCSSIKELYLESLLSFKKDTFNECSNLEIFYMPNLSHPTMDTRNFSSSSKLIDITFGKNFTGSFDFYNFGYSSIVTSKASSTLCYDTDLERYGQTFATNWDKWKWCIINHFAANLLDRSGMGDAFTITFGSTVLAQFDEEMIAAFTNKNWTLA